MNNSNFRSKLLIEQKKTRNFSIIAHIDHGKSTLADRILELTNSISTREMKNQLLDSMDLEQERGITIKLNAVQLIYKSEENIDYIFHLIDTPGHVDFTYEVSRSLAACEGAILIVDASQGIEAQTISNIYLALENNLEIIPVLNKIDLPNANVDKVKKEIIDLLGVDNNDILAISAKKGTGIKNVLEEVIKKIPQPMGDENKPLKALIFDSFFDTYRGVIVLVRIKDGTLSVGDKIKFMGSKAIYEVNEVGVNTPKEIKKEKLSTGEVGWFAASIKKPQDVQVGDTVTTLANPAQKPLEGYKKLKSMVFCGLFPIDSSQYSLLKEALEKLQLNDSSLQYELETSQALGFGFRCGFLGLLHMEIITERLDREFDLKLIITAPSVIYKVVLNTGEDIYIDNPVNLPSVQKIKSIEEPYVDMEIVTPTSYIGVIMELCQNKRGIYKNIEYITQDRAKILYLLPLSEIVYDFFDKLKSYTKGYASFDYEFSNYLPSKLVKLDILINSQVLDALSMIVHKDFAYNRGKIMTEKLKDLLPRQQFEIPIQAAIGSKIISRSTIKALRKNVLSKCYGGDITRKRKLLEKQKAGKKKMKYVGNVEVPQEAFLAALKLD